ncbi:hypothetical protein C7S18_15400 [Ahniella affigens]|uniref:Uncharacterized protein n=1 Tax=Ahniella affigens TaxID=2021234 RepID=A0A2P1PUG4_9GAMM|nr:hypothetical protein [Ahniella affigens]AVP98485.1 hypothetical protein C7S18_15400 [Ahniella affigens]
MSAQPLGVDQQKTDSEHLRLLVIFHYVCAGVMAFFALFPIIHLIMGIAIVAGWLPEQPGNESPAALGWIFIGVALMFMMIGFTFAGMVFRVARKLKARQSFTFCLVISGLLCLFMPMGTALGVFTIIVLNRPSVKALFDSSVAGSH